MNEEPVIKGPCAACQVCYYSCPRLELPIDEIEYFLFGRTRKPEEESLGIYKKIYSARAFDEHIWHAGQDGGTVIALMTHALQIGIIDCFATTDFTKSNSVFVLGSGMALKTVPVVGHTAEDLLRTAGSKYTHGGVLGVYRMRQRLFLTLDGSCCVTLRIARNLAYVFFTAGYGEI